MRTVDTAVLALLAGLRVVEESEMNTPDGPVDSEPRPVEMAFPYSVFNSNPGDAGGHRMAGRAPRRDMEFTLKHVGVDRQQVKWQHERCYAVLADVFVVVAGRKAWPIRLESSTQVFRDRTALDPETGSPLSYAVDTYAVSITQGSTA